MVALTNKAHIRWMIRKDMPAVLEIEKACFEFPWSEEALVRCLRHRARTGLVVEVDGRVVGFIIYEMHKHRFHIINIAVCPDAQRSGIATTMITKLVDKLSQGRRDRILLEVRESNLDAQLFFKSLRFRAISVQREFYDTGEDAYLMQYRHVPSEAELKAIFGDSARCSYT